MLLVLIQVAVAYELVINAGLIVRAWVASVHDECAACVVAHPPLAWWSVELTVLLLLLLLVAVVHRPS